MANIQFPFPLNGFVTSFQNVRYQRHFPKRQLPKSVLSAALGPPIVACGDSEGKFWKNWKMPLGKNLTFGKVSLGKLDIWEGATWSPLGKTFFFQKGMPPRDQRDGLKGLTKSHNFIGQKQIYYQWNIRTGRIVDEIRNCQAHRSDTVSKRCHCLF